MSEPLPDTPPSRPSEDRLDSWKEIAAYLNRDVTTVQRWEKREGMPVHRHLHDRMGSVYASRAELDAWARSRNLERRGTTATSSRPSLRRRRAAPSTGARPRKLSSGCAAAAAVALAIGRSLAPGTEFFWRSPIADARFQTVTDFDDVQQAAAVSRDGHFVAFLSDRDGPMDVWVTQVGSGQFHNLTAGTAPELVNPSVRMLGFSPDGSFVTFWRRKQAGRGRDISIWAVPTLGGQPRPYLEGVAEFDWSHDGARLAYHTPGPGTRCSCRMAAADREARPHLYRACRTAQSLSTCGRPTGRFIYFVLGSLPDKLDIWRIASEGGTPVRITSHHGRVSHPVLLDRRTLMYLASDPDGSGPWLYSMDVERRIPHRLTSGPDRYTSLAASADGHRLVAPSRVRRARCGACRLPMRPPRAGGCPHLADDRNGILPAAWSGLSRCTFADRSGESIWKIAGRHQHGALEWPGSADPRWSRDLARWTANRVLGPPGRANPLVRDASRRHERASRGRFARAAGRSGVGARWPVDHLGSGRPRRAARLFACRSTAAPAAS